MPERISPESLGHCALLVVDLQKAFEDPVFGRRNNPACEANVGRLVRAWRESGRPVVFVRHHEKDRASVFGPGRLRAFKPDLTGDPDLLVTKSVHSAFYGRPSLHRWLRSRGVDAVVVCGITTDHCCDTTARMASDLGYRVYFPLDATHTFDRTAPGGAAVPAELVAERVAASLDGEFAQVVATDQLV
jgi:nicotinamidase-related amidase